MRGKLIDITARLPKPPVPPEMTREAQAAEKRLQDAERWTLDVIANPAMYTCTAPAGRTWLRTALSEYWAATVRCDKHGVPYEVHPLIRAATVDMVEAASSDAQ